MLNNVKFRTFKTVKTIKQDLLSANKISRFEVLNDFYGLNVEWFSHGYFLNFKESLQWFTSGTGSDYCKS